MNILVMGDVMGPSGRKAIKKDLSKIIKDNNIGFTIINGENAADDGKGITMSFLSSLFGYQDKPATTQKISYIPPELKPYVDEVLKVALTKPLKSVEWVEVDQIADKNKDKKELSTH